MIYHPKDGYVYDGCYCNDCVAIRAQRLRAVSQAIHPNPTLERPVWEVMPYTSDSGFELTKAYDGDAGFDLPVAGDWYIEPGVSHDIPTGIRVAIPEGYYGRITGRSSAHRKHGITVREGIIDSGFRGELFTYMTNENAHGVELNHGQRLAQLIISPVPAIHPALAESLPESERGAKGFGSSGR